MAWYDTGSVNVTNGSASVVGVGTNFIAGAQVGEGFYGPDNRLYEIQAIVSATALTLADVYLGTTQTGQGYKIVPTQSLVAALATQVSTLISDFQGVVDEAGSGKFDDGTAASAGITFTLDQDTGIFRPAANQIGFTTAGVERAKITNAGIDVTGTVTADGLTVDGNAVVQSSEPRFILGETDVSGQNTRFRNAGGDLQIQTIDDAYVAAVNRISLDHATGDISFYEDTGTTPKFFWDASTERLGIGISSPSSHLHVNSGAYDTIATFESEDRYGALKLKDSTSTASTGGITLGVDGDALYVQTGSVNSNAMRIEASGNVGIGTTNAAYNLDLQSSGDTVLNVKSTGTGDADAIVVLDAADTGEAVVQFRLDGTEKASIEWYDAGPDLNIATAAGTNGSIDFQPNGSLAMRIEASGNVNISGNNATSDTRMFSVQSEGYAVIKINGDLSNTSGETGGSALQLSIDGTGVNGVVSCINADNDSGYGTTYTGTSGNSMLVGTITNDPLNFGVYNVAKLRLSTNQFFPVTDNAFDLGLGTNRYDDIFATNGTIQTSDRNEKEAIASLTPTEMLVAARLSTSFKNFKWKDAVAEKGAAARMHSGIIAQDVQDAFAAEGLDASDYAMFISGTWWETQTDVPAVEAVAEVVDEEGNVVTGAVEAKDAYTLTDTYHTLEEAPEGATERTRLGIRYPELLAFVAAYSDQRFLAIEARLTALEG
jgi:hypothetical protein